MTERRRYTKRQKATAVIAAEMSSVAAAAEQTGIPETNIRRWKDDPVLAEYGAKTRAEIADGFQMLTGLAIDHLAALVPTMEARDLITLAGVATDKSQLLSGQPTGRVATVTDGLEDHEKEALRAAIRKALAKEPVA